MAEIKKHIKTDAFNFDPESRLGVMVSELIAFARTTLEAQPQPCPHADIYPVSHASDQIVTMCRGCGQVLKVQERKGQEWVTVIENDPIQIILGVPSKCQRCGMNCERCAR